MGEVTWSMHVREICNTKKLFFLYVRRSCAQVRKQWHDSNSSSIQNTSKLEPSCFLDMELPKALDKSLSYNPCPSTNTKHRVSFLTLSSLLNSLSLPLFVFLSLSQPAQRIQAQPRKMHQSFNHPQSPFCNPHNPRIICISFSSAKAFPPPTSSFLYIFF